MSNTIYGAAVGYGLRYIVPPSFLPEDIISDALAYGASLQQHQVERITSCKAVAQAITTDIQMKEKMLENLPQIEAKCRLELSYLEARIATESVPLTPLNELLFQIAEEIVDRERLSANLLQRSLDEMMRYVQNRLQCATDGVTHLQKLLENSKQELKSWELRIRAAETTRDAIENTHEILQEKEWPIGIFSVLRDEINMEKKEPYVRLYDEIIAVSLMQVVSSE
jgi:hypothetical protein